jgi:hypothetical protein
MRRAWSTISARPGRRDARFEQFPLDFGQKRSKSHLATLVSGVLNADGTTTRLQNHE